MDAESNEIGRKSNGRFAQGNPGGPGRPRRAVEREYLATISDAVPLDVWRKIVDRAVSEATSYGGAKAREWLARYLLGDKPPSMLELAAAEHIGDAPEADIERKAVKLRNDARLDRLMDSLRSLEPSEE